MEFETLTVAPFDLEAIDWEELDSREKGTAPEVSAVCL